jgi:hypothetical protein
VSGPVQRQQSKWVALAFGLIVFFLLIGVVIPLVVLDAASGWFVWALPALAALSPLLPASIAIAILRHHLYDIDRLLSRTLTYGLLTVVLGSLYAGAVVVLGQALNPRGGDSSLAVAASTLLIAALFHPLRRRIQAMVHRRFNRRRYDAAKTVEAFSAQLREHVDLDTLSAEVLGVVDQTMQPTTALLWLRPRPARPRTSARQWHSGLNHGRPNLRNPVVGVSETGPHMATALATYPRCAPRPEDGPRRRVSVRPLTGLACRNAKWA